MPFWKNRPKIFGGRKEAPTPIDTVAVQAVNNKTAPPETPKSKKIDEPQMLEEGVKTSIRHPRQTAAPTLELPAIKIKTLARVEIDYLEEEGEREPQEEAREEDPATQIDIRPSKKNKRVLTEQERRMVLSGLSRDLTDMFLTRVAMFSENVASPSLDQNPMTLMNATGVAQDKLRMFIEESRIKDFTDFVVRTIMRRVNFLWEERVDISRVSDQKERRMLISRNRILAKGKNKDYVLRSLLFHFNPPNFEEGSETPDAAYFVSGPGNPSTRHRNINLS